MPHEKRLGGLAGVLMPVEHSEIKNKQIKINKHRHPINSKHKDTQEQGKYSDENMAWRGMALFKASSSFPHILA